MEILLQFINFFVEKGGKFKKIFLNALEILKNIFAEQRKRICKLMHKVGTLHPNAIALPTNKLVVLAFWLHAVMGFSIVASGA